MAAEVACEQSSLLDHQFTTNVSYPDQLTTNSIPQDNSTSVNVVNPFSSNLEPSVAGYQSLTASDPREILFALDRAADFLRGQVEEKDRHQPGGSRR